MKSCRQNLLDELKRDRRWCHGNLMNFRLFLVKGMHPVHRAVFLTGVMSYLSAPLWFMFLALSTALQVVHALTEPQYFLQPRQLFPVWAAVASGTGNCAVCVNHGAAIPAEAAQYYADLV
ncbi:glucosyltransferase MdoH [Salmonella enterica subsp. indica]|uniref:Glucosyltransferase MdoH n=2 Tax=Salmonella enterica TaxID=28901 RepID=A0A379XRE8_SALER|nr:glucosyltransferase MdoH [Salmonella enterica subsp. indica]